MPPARFGVVLLVFATACAAKPAPPTTVPARAPAASAPAEVTSSYVKGLKARIGTASPLSLHARLQGAAERALLATHKAGAVVALEPDTGVVRALFSVSKERGDPLLVAHVPASAFKPIAAFAGLEAGVLGPTTEKECVGKFPFGGKELHDAGPHGHLTTQEAIYKSCNVFFYSMATRIRHARLLEVARRFGFGAPTGIELPEEAGTVEDDARAQAIKSDAASTVPLLDASGHGEIKATLLQLARAYAAIANGGKILRLGLTGAGVERTISLRPPDLALIRAALVQVVANEAGSAHSAEIAGFPFAGKTGSAEAQPLNGIETDDDRLFVAYAPPENPKILVAARVERANQEHGAVAVVKAVLEAWRGQVR
jgi:cell division protein FtsI/penicillin-binding protein 2